MIDAEKFMSAAEKCLTKEEFERVLKFMKLEDVAESILYSEIHVLKENKRSLQGGVKKDEGTV